MGSGIVKKAWEKHSRWITSTNRVSDGQFIIKLLKTSLEFNMFICRNRYYVSIMNRPIVRIKLSHIRERIMLSFNFSALPFWKDCSAESQLQLAVQLLVNPHVLERQL